MDCINKEDKNFKSVAKKYGDTLATRLSRKWIDASTKNTGMPTLSQINDLLKGEKEGKKINLLEALAIDPYMNEESIRSFLVGVVKKKDGKLYLTTGTGRSKIETEVGKKTILGPNKALIEQIQREYPGLIELEKSKFLDSSYRVKITPNTPTKEQQAQMNVPFPNEITQASIENWLEQKGITDSQGIVIDENRFKYDALPEVTLRAQDLQYDGTPFQVNRETGKVIYTDKFFDDIAQGIKNIPLPSNKITVSVAEHMKNLDQFNLMVENSEAVKEQVNFEDPQELADYLEHIEQNRIINKRYNPNDIQYQMQTFDSESNKGNLSDAPVNFREWYEKRVELLDKLNDTRSALLKRKADKRDIDAVKNSIKSLEEELESFDPQDPKNVYSHVYNEIEDLKQFVKRQIDGDVESAMEIENNRILERLDMMNEYFSSVTIFKDDTEYKETTIQFNQNFSPEEVARLRQEIEGVRDALDKNIDKILENIVKNTGHVRELKEELSPEKYSKFMQRVNETLMGTLEDNKKDRSNIISENLYGATSYGNILSALLATERDSAAHIEAGITADWKTSLEEAWAEIRNKKVKIGGKNQFVSDLLFQKDEFGQRVSKLINMYTSDHYSNIGRNGVAVYRTDFFTSTNKTEAYRNWMNFEKDSFDYIDLSRISSFVNKHINNPDLNKAFESSPQDMAQYEKEMREKLGDTVFELELQKQIDGINNFLGDSFNTDGEKYHRNPLLYIKNFYTSEYNKADNTTFEFKIPIKAYVNPIPKIEKQDEYYNKDFRQIENQIGDNFKEFYSSAFHLLNYTKDTMDAEALINGKRSRMNFNDILQTREHYKTEMARDMAVFGSVYSTVKKGWKDYGDRFTSATLLEKEVKSLKDMNLKTHLGAVGASLPYEARTAFMAETHARLVELVRAEGMPIPDAYLVDDKFSKSKLADALTRKIFNKYLSLDPRKGIIDGANLAESVNARRKVWGLAELIEKFNTEKKEVDASAFMVKWNSQQLAEEGFLNIGPARKITRIKLRSNPFSKESSKRLSDLDKDIRELLRDKQVMNKKSPENIEYDFDFDGFNYIRNDDGTYTKKDLETDAREPATLEQVKGKFNEFTDQLILGLGSQRTVGSFLGGGIANFRQAHLSYNPTSGVTNRDAGYVQNNMLAASGLYGFSYEDLASARKFLFGSNTIKTINYTPGIAKLLGVNKRRKVKQWKMLEAFVEKLGAQDNIINDMDLGTGRVIQRGAFKQFMSDFAVNNAEHHNQMEIFVALLSNVEIEVQDGETGQALLDSDGKPVTEPFFNIKTGELPFDPDTGKLLGRYNTKNNEANWVHFQPDQEGRAKHKSFLSKFTVAKLRGQGNYKDTDSLGIESTVSGKSLIVFQKWFFENFRNEWGEASVDYMTGEVDRRGAKMVLSEHYLSFGMFVGLQNITGSGSMVSRFMAVSTGIFGIAGLLNPVLGGAMLASTIGWIALANRKKIFNKESVMNLLRNLKDRILLKNKTDVAHRKSELKLAASFLGEIMLRSTRSAVKSGTGGVLLGVVGKNVMSDAKIKKWSLAESVDVDGTEQLPMMHTNLTLEERKLISSSAQQIAEKVGMFVKYTLLSLITKRALMLAFAGDDDEDEEELNKKVEEINKVVHKIINMEKNINTELAVMTDPTKLSDFAMSRIFFGSTIRKVENLMAFEDYADNTKTSDEVLSTVIGSALQLGGAPKQLTDIASGIIKDDNYFSVFQDDKIYEGRESLWGGQADILMYGAKNQYMEKDLKSKRSKLHKVLKPTLIKNFKNSLEPGVTYTNDEIEKIAKSFITEVVYKENGLNFDKNTDYENMEEKDFAKIRDAYLDAIPYKPAPKAKKKKKYTR